MENVLSTQWWKRKDYQEILTDYFRGQKCILSPDNSIGHIDKVVFQHPEKSFPDVGDLPPKVLFYINRATGGMSVFTHDKFYFANEQVEMKIKELTSSVKELTYE